MGGGIAPLGVLGGWFPLKARGHGSTATVHKYHRQYGRQMVCLRSFLHMCRPLVNEAPEAVRVAKLCDIVQRLGLRRPEKVTGRHIFCGDLMSAARQSNGHAKLSRDAMAEIMRSHGQLFRNLPMSQRMQYEKRAREKVLQDRAAVTGMLIHTRTHICLQEARARDESQDQGLQHRLVNCRLSDVDMSECALLYMSDAFSWTQVQRLRQQAMSPPEVPSAAEQAKVLQYDVDEGEAVGECPFWSRQVCKYRDAFYDCGFRITIDGSASFYAFCFALQSPMCLMLQPLRPAAKPAPSFAASAHEELSRMDSYFEHSFVVDGFKFVDSVCIHVGAEPDIAVLPELSFHGDGMCSHADFISLDDFLAPLLVGVDLEAPKRVKQESVGKVDGSLLQKHPWLKKYYEPKPPQQSGVEPGVDGSDEETSDEEEEGILGVGIEAIVHGTPGGAARGRLQDHDPRRILDGNKSRSRIR